MQPCEKTNYISYLSPILNIIFNPKIYGFFMLNFFIFIQYEI